VALCGLLVLAVAGCASTPSQKLEFQPAKMDASFWVPRVDRFVLVMDDSLSMSSTYKGEPKVAIERDLASSLSQSIPELSYTAGVRSFGQGNCLPKGKTSLITGMARYSEASFAQAIAKVTCPNGGSPLNKALDAVGEDLAGAKKSAVIIITDGLHMGVKVVEAAKRLKARYGEQLCIYPIQVGDDPAARALLQRVAAAGGCGAVAAAEDLLPGNATATFVQTALLYRDSDGDGVPDQLDKCPNTPKGVKVDANGCPLDSDGDGVPDYLDKCPDTPKGVKVDANGCPLDSDGDGVPDYLDKCPDTPRATPVDKDGCPLKGVTVVGDKWSVEGKVLFDTNKYTLKPAAKEVLVKVAEYLTANQKLTVEIQGHTDSAGKLPFNMKLSEERAKAVRDFLVAHGVGAERLTAVGFGPEQPVASNDKPEGRAKNRRVDFKPTTK
jgi:OmpA-OmpF porin, OOP family